MKRNLFISFNVAVIISLGLNFTSCISIPTKAEIEAFHSKQAATEAMRDEYDTKQSETLSPTLNSILEATPNNEKPEKETKEASIQVSPPHPTLVTNVFEEVKDLGLDFYIFNRKAIAFEKMFDPKAEISLENPPEITILKSGSTTIHNLILQDYLLTYAADINARDSYGMTALMHQARKTVDPEVIRLLIDNGASLELRDQHGKTALMHAAQYQSNPEILFTLIESKARVDVVDLDGNTPLLLAAENSNPEIAKILITSGSNINAKNNQGYNFLLYSIENAMSIDLIRLAIENGADVNESVTSDSDVIPLNLAIINDGGIDLIKLLIANGAKVNPYSYSDYHITPLMWAARSSSDPELLKELINAGALVNKQYSTWNRFDNYTPLMFAAEFQKNPEIIALLLLSGADGHTEFNYSGDTAFDLAKENEYLINTEVYWMLNDAKFGVLDLDVVKNYLDELHTKDN